MEEVSNLNVMSMMIVATSLLTQALSNKTGPLSKEELLVDIQKNRFLIILLSKIMKLFMAMI